MSCLVAYVKSENVELIEAAKRMIFIETGMTHEWGMLDKPKLDYKIQVRC